MGKNIYMVFPDTGEGSSRKWYKVEHDKLFEILKAKHGHAPKWNHPKQGEYWHCPVSKELATQLKSYLIE